MSDEEKKDQEPAADAEAEAPAEASAEPAAAAPAEAAPEAPAAEAPAEAAPEAPAPAAEPAPAADAPAAATPPAAAATPAAATPAATTGGGGGGGGNRGPGGGGGGYGNRGPGGGGGYGNRGPGGNRGGGNRGPGGRGRRDQKRGDDFGDGIDKPELTEKVVFINRCAKVVKGGRRFSFSALVVAGDQKGKVGFGYGKANEVAEAIRKASDDSKLGLEKIAMTENTIPHEVLGEFGGGKVLLKPACPGTGIIAGGSVRAVIEAAGIKDILAKSIGSSNHANVVKATLKALRSLRSRDEIYKLRGKKPATKEAI